MNDSRLFALRVWQQSPPRLRAFLHSLRRLGPFAAGVLAALIAVVLYAHFTPTPHQVTPAEVDARVAQVLGSATPWPAYSALVYQVIQPSLVLIQAKVPNAAGTVDNSLGSGVIIDANGDIMTALHVVANATSIKLTFADGTQSDARVSAKQAANDIAVLQAKQLPAPLVPATLGNPNAMHVGDEAYVVGNPFGLYSSMSAGVISGFGRSFQMPNSTQKIQNLIQVDAAVNPGNSGGPLLNRSGQVIGIVEGLLNPTDQSVFIGIGFAVPIDTAGGAAGMPLD